MTYIPPTHETNLITTSLAPGEELLAPRILAAFAELRSVAKVPQEECRAAPDVVERLYELFGDPRRYAFGDAPFTAPPRFWGIPIVTDPALAPGSFRFEEPMPALFVQAQDADLAASILRSAARLRRFGGRPMSSSSSEPTKNYVEPDAGDAE